MHEYFNARLPLFYVFLSGIGFSLQTLIIKLLSEQGFHGSFQCVFFRGFIQLILASYFVYNDENRKAGTGPKLFGDTNFVRLMLFLRGFLGFGGIAFSFLAVELIPIGDATVLTMLSPLLASILGFFILGEPWRLPEFFATVVSLIGAVMVAKPPFIFGGGETDSSEFYKGVCYALAASVFASFAYIIVRILGTTAKMPWSNVCFAQAIAQIVMAIPSMYIFGQHLAFDVTLLQWCMLITGGLIGAISQILMTIGMQREKSAAATAMRMSDVAFGFVWQVAFTSDPLSLLSLAGAVLVTCSILIIVVFKQTPPPVDKDLELTQLSSAISSLRDTMQHYDEMELGFEDDEAELQDHSYIHDITDSVDSPHYNKTGGQNSAQRNSRSNGIHSSSSGGSNGNSSGSSRDSNGQSQGTSKVGSGAEADAAEYSGMDDVFNPDPSLQSFLQRITTSPLYSGQGGGAGKSHQYSTLSQGELDSSEHADL